MVVLITRVQRTVVELLALKIELVALRVPRRVEALLLQLANDRVAYPGTEFHSWQGVVEVLRCWAGACHEQDVRLGGQRRFKRSNQA